LIRGKFILNVLHKATPAALTNLAMISIMMVAGRVMNLRFEVLSTCCTMVWAVVGLTYLYRICKPFDIYKKIIFALCTGGMIFSMIFLKNLFGLERDLGFEGWTLVTIVAILTIPMLKFQAWLIEKIIGLYEKYVVKTVEKLPSISEKVDQAHENREQRVAKHFTKFAAWRDGHKGKWLGK
jgi:cation-transporting ATPase E